MTHRRFVWPCLAYRERYRQHLERISALQAFNADLQKLFSHPTQSKEKPVLS